MLRRDGLRYWNHLSLTGQDRTGREKGQVPGRQINLMKFVIDHGNISLVIKAEINHKKLLIKTLAISLSPFPSFP